MAAAIIVYGTMDAAKLDLPRGFCDFPNGLVPGNKNLSLREIADITMQPSVPNGTEP